MYYSRELGENENEVEKNGVEENGVEENGVEENEKRYSPDHSPNTGRLS
jgi:hypothetical protein